MAAEQLSSLIGTIYDSALDAARWQDAVEHACRFLNCTAGALSAVDLVGTYNLGIHWGYAPKYWESYLSHYHRIDPLNATALRTQIGEVGIASRLKDWPVLLASPIYREWAAPQGFVDFIYGTLDRSATGLAMLTCVRHKSVGPATSSDLERMALILPHFRKAFLIGKLLDLNSVRLASFVEAINGIAVGVFFLGPRGELVHVNVAGSAMLAAEDPVVRRRDRLRITTEAGQRALTLTLSDLAAGGGQIEGLGGLQLQVAGRKGERYTGHVLPLTSGDRVRLAAASSAIAVLFLRRASVDINAAIKAATPLYGLTPAEGRVLAALVEGGGLPGVAARLGVTRKTVQTHVEHLFAKTGTSRQAELVGLVAGFDRVTRDDK